MQRQRVDEWAKAQVLRTLRHGGEKDAWRGRKSKGRGMVLGQVIAVNAQPVVGLDQFQAALVVLTQRRGGAIEMVEDAELHVRSSRFEGSHATALHSSKAAIKGCRAARWRRAGGRSPHRAAGD